MRKVVPSQAILVPKEAKRVFKGVIYDTYQWPQKLYDGSVKTFEMLKRVDSVKILAIKDDKILVLEQQQPHLHTFYDIPGGMHDDPKEDELEAAKRELLEETGMVFANWKLIEVIQPSFKIEQFVYTFLATDFISETSLTPDAGEKIIVRLLTLDEVKKLVDSPSNRYLPKDILSKVSSIDDLISLPEYKGKLATE